MLYFVKQDTGDYKQTIEMRSVHTPKLEAPIK